MYLKHFLRFSRERRMGNHVLCFIPRARIKKYLAFLFISLNKTVQGQCATSCTKHIDTFQRLITDLIWSFIMYLHEHSLCDQYYCWPKDDTQAVWKDFMDVDNCKKSIFFFNSIGTRGDHSLSWWRRRTNNKLCQNKRKYNFNPGQSKSIKIKEK